MKLTNSKIKYLIVIYKLASKGERVRSTDIANELGVSRPSVNRMLNSLTGKKLLYKEPYGPVRFTSFGEQIVSEYVHKYEKITQYFKSTLKFSTIDAERCAIFLLSEMSGRNPLSQ